MQRASLRLLITIVFLSVLFFLARFVLVPISLSLPEDFSYSAELLSFDNFYDEETQMFSGESRSVTTFSYIGKGKKEEDILIDNVFDVRTVSGEKIISIRREYLIDKYNWTHVPNFENQKKGFLFAPRHLKPQDFFSYRHINYDQELDLVFEQEEFIEGIRTFRYTTSFGVDQTNDLTHLEGVPEERGVNLDVSLRLWIEPTSGWLVKYTDSAIAYYYDIETGQRINPWNKFRNTYSKPSIVDHITAAQERKIMIFLIEIGTPIIGALLLSILLFWGTRWRKISIILFLISVALAITYSVLAPRFKAEEEPILIGISRWVPTDNEAYTENIQGFKDSLEESGFKEGEDVIYIEETANSNPIVQEEVIRSFIEKDVGLIYSLTTPGTAIVKDLVPNRPIIFSIVTYPVESGLIESLKNSGNNLVGTRNWVPIKQQLDVFREIVPNVSKIGFIHREGELNSNIQLQEMTIEAENLDIDLHDISGNNLVELLEALESSKGEVDALFSACDTLVQGEAEKEIIAFAKKELIPSFSCNNSGPLNGDLIGTVVDFYTIGRLAGEKAVLVLEGATPTSLETKTVTRPFIYINELTAELLNIVIPQGLLINADRIVR